MFFFIINCNSFTSFGDIIEHLDDELPVWKQRLVDVNVFGYRLACFGKREDVFLHIEVLRQSGLSDLQPGEALAMRVIKGKRGNMAAEVQAWETVLSIKENDAE